MITSFIVENILSESLASAVQDPGLSRDIETSSAFDAIEPSPALQALECFERIKPAEGSHSYRIHPGGCSSIPRSTVDTSNEDVI